MLPCIELRAEMLNPFPISFPNENKFEAVIKAVEKSHGGINFEHRPQFDRHNFAGIELIRHERSQPTFANFAAATRNVAKRFASTDGGAYRPIYFVAGIAALVGMFRS